MEYQLWLYTVESGYDTFSDFNSWRALANSFEKKSRRDTFVKRCWNPPEFEHFLHHESG